MLDGGGGQEDREADVVRPGGKDPSKLSTQRRNKFAAGSERYYLPLKKKTDSPTDSPMKHGLGR